MAGTVRFDRPGVELDLGGIGKGYAVDRVVSLLRQRGIASALVNLGGSSVYGLGAPPEKQSWEIGIQDPTDPAKTALAVPLRDRALSVSGGYARSFESDGVTYAHIMDPRNAASKVMARRLLRVGNVCKSVLACRVSPAQKAAAKAKGAAVKAAIDSRSPKDAGTVAGATRRAAGK